MPDALYTVLLPTGLAASIALLLVLALRPALQRVPAKLRRLALTLVTLLFLLPLPTIAHGISGLLPQGSAPAITQTLGESGPAAPIYAAGEALGEALQASSAPVSAPTPPVAQPDTPAIHEPAEQTPANSRALPSPLVLLGWAYALGLAVTAATCIIRYCLFAKKLRKNSAPVTDTRLEQQYAALCKELAIKRSPALLQSGMVASPLLIGALRPRIVLPESNLQDADFCGWALRHELVHHRHGDVPFKLLVQAVLVLHWYNPLCRLLRREVDEACEQSCDETVVQALTANQRKLYAFSLLQCAEARFPFAAAGFAGQAGRLKKRLGRLLHPVTAGRGRRAAILSAVSMVCCLGILAGCTLAAGTGNAAAPASNSLAASFLEGILPEDAPVEEPPASKPADLPTSKEQEPKAFLRLFHGGYGSNGLIIPLPAEEEYSQTYFDVDITNVETEDLASYVEEYFDGIITLPQEILESLESAVTEYFQAMDLLDELQNLQTSCINPLPEYTYSSRGFGGAHRGLDLVAPYGTPIYAAKRGTVINASYHSSYGYNVLIDHGDGITSRYAHCSELLVEQGQEVAQGDLIAEVGASGDSSGNQLHFEIMVNGVFADPLNYIPLALAECAWPVPGHYTISQYFGQDTHRGIDISAPSGAPVCSANAGTVVAAVAGHESYGNYILIDHGNGMKTLYAHLDEILVSEGEVVVAMSLIGTVGQTGMADEPCLHFEVIEDEYRQNPLKYISSE